MHSPLNYRTESGLLAAIKKTSAGDITVAVARWLNDAKWVLVSNWEWSEKEAAVIRIRQSVDHSLLGMLHA